MYFSKEKILSKLQKIQDKELFAHSQATCQMAFHLAEALSKKDPTLKINIKKIETASLLHDWAKDFSKKKLISESRKYNISIDKYEIESPGLLHGPVGAKIVEKELGVKDKEILKAIRNHTTGSNKMTVLDRIIFVADHIEINRDYRMLNKIRKTALRNFNKAVLMVLENKIHYVLQKKVSIHPKTISAWNMIAKENI